MELCKLKSTIQCCFVFSIVWIAALQSHASKEVVLVDIEKANETCGQILLNPVGQFHLNQKNFTGTCYWSITPHNGTKISIFIDQLFLDSNDTVTFYKTMNEAKNGSSPLFDREIKAQSDSLTFITEEPAIFIKLVGSPTVQYQRKFEGHYQSQSCSFPIPPTVTTMTYPIFGNLSEDFECDFTYSMDLHFQRIPTFVFEEFNLSGHSSFILSGSSHDGPYNNAPPIEFYPASRKMDFVLTGGMNSINDSFRLRLHPVNPLCCKYIEVKNDETITSPPFTLDNGTVTHECRWILHSSENKILGITFNKMEFDSVLDIVSINNGASEMSTPMMQITASNHNFSSQQMIRTTGSYVWISFKPQTFKSNFSANVTVHGQGGYYNGSGDIKMIATTGNDTVFLLEVDKEHIVLLNFTSSSFAHPATLSIYDDFQSTNLLTTLHGNVWYPILSRTSKMMIIATGFNAGSFNAVFKGILPGCMHMSTPSSDSYILSGNCNSTCTWIIPPQDTSNNELLLDLQYLSLKKNDSIEIIHLDADKTHLGHVYPNVSHVPELSVQADVGVLVNITRGICKNNSDDIILIGHTSYMPACKINFQRNATEGIFQVLSPNYPDTYPLLSKCIWNIDVPKDNLVHLAFNELKLAPNHCVNITQVVDNQTSSHTGSKMPDDSCIKGNAVIQFDSSNCGGHSKVAESLVSDEGFVINVTVADCGTTLSAKSGNLNVSDVKDKTMCVWKISIPETDDDKSVNVIVLNVATHDDKGELFVYDGVSTRDPKILNLTSETWSRTNNLIVTYKPVGGSSKLAISYTTKSCNESMQCANKICMHPDWRCDGNNDCGDFSDERNCASVPIPPQENYIGFSSSTYGISIVLFFVLGVILALGIPYLYQRYRNGQYRRFGEISVIE